MNNLQSNEKHLADKLRQAPVPDVNRGWEQMRELLDSEMPEAVVGGWAGNKRWWWMGITAALIMAAVWLTQELNQREQKGVAVKTQKENNGNATQSNVAKNENINNQTIAGGESASQGAMTDENANEDNKEAKAVSTKENNLVTNDESVDVKDNAENKTGNTRISGKKNISEKDATSKSFITKNNKAVSQSAVLKNEHSDIAKNESKNIVKPGRVDASNNDRNSITTEKNIFSSEQEMSATRQAIGVNFNEKISSREPVNVADEFENINFSASGAIAVSGKTDKAYLRQLRKKLIKEDNRRMSKAGMRGGFGDDGREITFAAGITVPQSFALGQQQSSAYSVSGKSSRFMDYLPAPFFQYHVNNKLFLQTEFHFQSPQYTDRLLLARSTTNPATNVRLEKNVYLEKLYYFNIPINVYYTPAKNFSIGSGLQYSSLLSGVASFEERRIDGQTTSSYQSVTRRFKDDSVAAKFSPSEWRYQFDANYYLKRFTLGLRYNQALKDFVNLQVGPGLPATQDRNKSFLLYLRFNIWEERKKE